MGVFCQELVKMRVGNNEKEKTEDKPEDRQISRAPEEVLGQQKRSVFLEQEVLLKCKTRPAKVNQPGTEKNSPMIQGTQKKCVR